MPDPHTGDGESHADAEAHVEIKIVGKDRIHGSHALVPALQDPLVIENRVGDDRDDQADQSSDHGPKGQDHPDK